MDENIFINLRVDDHYPKPFKVISLRRQVYESSILKHGRGECKENLKKWSKTTDPQIKKKKKKKTTTIFSFAYKINYFDNPRGDNAFRLRIVLRRERSRGIVLNVRVL